MRLQTVLAYALTTFVIGISGCAYTPIFGFPRESGDIEAGRQAFVDHQCHRCHSVSGERLPQLAGADAPILELGGETIYVKSYADLMTSVINPEHRISERYRDQMMRQGTIPIESPMPQPHVDTMTVRQLIDIVSFLDARYQLIEGYDASF